MYRVLWLEATVDELTTIWLQASSALRQAITLAAHRAEQLLVQHGVAASRNALGQGMHACFVGPLGITFRLEPDGITLTILHVWLIVPHQTNGQAGGTKS
jgi:hypothetical protein